jgi:serine/threonine-protein kinase
MIDDDVTMDALTGAATRSSMPAGHARAQGGFEPGAIVAGRYRLVSLLGRGGMGEVYRADDLTLDQPVALKFLPGIVDTHDSRLAQFHNELRVARQVSHKNVCRLYDLGEADGRRFLTMEYVDGEDLGTSLRRFGRMPPDKSLQIARQLCAGVAAAHEKGVLHRDLKPGNIMLDGAGDVRITDFGIATAVDSVAETRGTPPYMAPELLTGKPASIRTDLYALGLILFEVFTGRRAYEGRTIAEVRQLHDTDTITTPSTLVRDIDPAVERVILWCLDKDPARRPASALAIAAALPGANPLAAALEAGETPSPELLVAAGESQAMPVRQALALMAAFIVMLLVGAAIVSRGAVISLTPTPLPPDALADRASQMLGKLGYHGDVADWAMGIAPLGDYLGWEQKKNPTSWWKQLQQGRPPAMIFWYRTSPREMRPTMQAGAISLVQPPMSVSGMHSLVLDMEGRLVEFHSVPPQMTSGVGGSADAPPVFGIPLDGSERPRAFIIRSPNAEPWSTVFEAAGLDKAAFTAVTPQWIPRDFADTVTAWEGPMPGRADLNIRVEAAALGDRVISFQIIWPWTVAARVQVPQQTDLERLRRAASILVWVGLLCGAGLFARRHVQSNRADRRGALRLGTTVVLLSFAAQLFSATHVTDAPTEVTQQILGALANAGLAGAINWVLYLAVEPYARRFWPGALLGWTRLLSGRIRDPRVGRELLFGVCIGCATVVTGLIALAPMWLGRPMPQLPFGQALPSVLSLPLLFARWLNEVVNGLQSALAVVMIFVVMRLLLKRSWMAIVAGVLLLLVVADSGRALSGAWMDTFNTTLFIALMVLTLYGFGVVAMATALCVANLVSNTPLTMQLSHWWSTPTVLTLGAVIALGCFAFAAARAGQPLLGADT